MTRVLIVGNGPSAQRLAETLMTKGFTGTVTILGEEPRGAYDRVALTVLPHRGPRPRLPRRSRASRSSSGEQATSIEPEAKTVNGTIPYDVLVLATGSAPFVPPVPGTRTSTAATSTGPSTTSTPSGRPRPGPRPGRRRGRRAPRAGGGRRAARAGPGDAHRRDEPVADAPPGRRGRRRRAEAARGGPRADRAHELRRAPASRARRRVTGLRTLDGLIEAQVVVFSAGIRPRDELARAAGVKVGERGGIVVDDGMRTSDPAIYAIGECALHDGQIYGLVAPCMTMAETAADRIMGGAGGVRRRRPVDQAEAARRGGRPVRRDGGRARRHLSRPGRRGLQEAVRQRRRRDPARRHLRRRRRAVRHAAPVRRRAPLLAAPSDLLFSPVAVEAAGRRAGLLVQRRDQERRHRRPSRTRASPTSPGSRPAPGPAPPAAAASRC